MTIEILTAALVLITAFYAWATFKILGANEKVVEVILPALKTLGIEVFWVPRRGDVEVSGNWTW